MVFRKPLDGEVKFYDENLFIVLFESVAGVERFASKVNEY